jgi:hypothetical protein
MNPEFSFGGDTHEITYEMVMRHFGHIPEQLKAIIIDMPKEESK